MSEIGFFDNYQRLANRSNLLLKNQKPKLQPIPKITTGTQTTPSFQYRPKNETGSQPTPAFCGIPRTYLW